MPTRIIARELRLVVALAALTQSRSRAKEFPAALLERQRRDHRGNRRDSTQPAAVLATVAALSQGQGMTGAQRAAGSSGGYYDGGGDGGGYGGGGDPQ